MDKQNISHCKVFGIQLCLKKRLLVSACCILLFFFLPSPQLPSSPCLPSQQVAGLGHAECTPTYKVFLNLAFVCAQLFSHVWLFVTPWTVAPQAPLSVEFPRQQCWVGLLFPSPGDLPSPGIKPVSPPFPALLADSLSLSHLGSQTTLYPFKNVPVLPLGMYYYQLGEL